MHQSRLYKWTLILGTGWLLFAASWVASAIGLCEFSSPTTNLSQLFLTVNYTYLDLPTTQQVDVNSGQFSFSFSHVHDEMDRSFSAGASSEISLDQLRLARAMSNAHLTIRSYDFVESPVYFFAEVQADYGTASAQSGLELRLGTGYGRMTDVNPLAKAIRIGDTLTKDLVLAAPLSDDALQSIGQLIAREAELSGIGELVSQIADVIKNETQVELSPRSLLTIAEQIRGTTVSQRCGWTAQIGLGYELVRRFGNSRQLLLTMSSDFARPLSLASQVRAQASVSYPLFVENASALNASILYNRKLSETTRLVAEAATQRVQQIGKTPTVGESLEIQFQFELGRIDLVATASISRGTGMPGWVESLTIAATIDLL